MEDLVVDRTATREVGKAGHDRDKSVQHVDAGERTDSSPAAIAGGGESGNRESTPGCSSPALRGREGGELALRRSAEARRTFRRFRGLLRDGPARHSIRRILPPSIRQLSWGSMTTTTMGIPCRWLR